MAKPAGIVCVVSSLLYSVYSQAGGCSVMSAMTERTTAQTDAADTYDASNEATTPCGGGGCGGSELTDLDDGENNTRAVVNSEQNVRVNRYDWRIIQSPVSQVDCSS